VSIWFVRLFTLPHTIIGIVAFGYWALMVLWALFASDIPGVVTKSDVHNSSKGGTSYTLKYQFEAGGERKSGSSGVSQSVYERIRAADAEQPAVTVRYFKLGAFEHDELREARGAGWAEIGFLTLWVVFWNSIMSVFAYAIWIRPIRVRLLYKHGETTAGTLVGKRVRSGKNTSYYVSYEFRHPVTGEMLRAETQVPNGAAWNMAREGQDVTVLYALNNPKRSAVYEFSGYGVISDDHRSDT
jgi:hypothetical protein